MDWVGDFYSRSGSWWGEAEARVTDRDHRRVDQLRAHTAAPGSILELGSGYGTTAVATATSGYTVTAVEISDRADFTATIATDVAPGSLSVHKADFFAVEFAEQFDAVCYWNGFGVGSDADQRRLLGRIASEWLRPGGVALIDVANPFVWASWDGDEEDLRPDAAAGYRHELRQRIRFDPLTCTATDTWWDKSDPDNPISQHLRCYTPADLALLTEGTGLSLRGIVVGDRTVPLTPHPDVDALLRKECEYLVVLRRTADE